MIFSIVIPLYNKERHITDTLTSVLEQTYQNFEIIVVNDGSTDKSVDEVTSIQDDRVKLFNIENHGVSYARNYGIARASYDFIAFLDADDYWYKNHLEELKDLIEEFPGCGIYAKAYKKMFYDTTVLEAKFSNLEHNCRGILEDYFQHSLIDAIAWTSAVAIPKRMFQLYGNFDPELLSGQDTDMWIRIALMEKVAFDSSISAKKIIHNATNHLSLSSSIADRIKLLYRYKDQENNNPNFKTYMMLNRFSVALERKMAGDYNSFDSIRKDIDTTQLNWKQRILLKSPKGLLKTFKKTQQILLKKNVYLTGFR